MKRLAFRKSDEDRLCVAQLELDGTHITVNLDTTACGVMAVREDAISPWNWLAEIGIDDAFDADNRAWNAISY